MEKILDFIQDSWQWVLLCIFIGFIVIWIVTHHLSQSNKKISLFFGMVEYIKENNQSNYIPLVDHPLFGKFNSWIDIGIPNINTSNLDQKPIIMKFIHIKFNVWRENLYILSENKDLHRLTNQNLYNYLVNDLKKSVSAYEDEWRKSGIPEEMIKTFKENHESRVNTVMKSIHGIVYSNFYSDFNQKMSAVFDAYMFSLNMTIIDVESSFN